MSRNGALKVLDHALNSEAGKENCAKFVEILGLRTIFPLFMKTPKKTKRKGMSAEEFEGTHASFHCVREKRTGHPSRWADSFAAHSSRPSDGD